uniref:Uncharacterized protein n=1 Tax=Piliocolobus tephrosceles TaxID=591936 RepID=A0A8C9GAA3_9PRIM
MSAPEPPAGDGIQAMSPAGSKCCCPQGNPASCWGPSALLCCTGYFHLHGLRSLSLCLFFPIATVQDFPHYPLPPFLHSLVSLTFPEPCKCVLFPRASPR